MPNISLWTIPNVLLSCITIDSVNLDKLNDYLARREYGEFTITSIGPVELKSPGLTV